MNFDQLTKQEEQQFESRYRYFMSKTQKRIAEESRKIELEVEE